MSRTKAPFRRSDVAAAIKAVRSTGLNIARVEIDREGKIVVVIGEPTKAEAADDIDREIASFRAKHERQPSHRDHSSSPDELARVKELIASGPTVFAENAIWPREEWIAHVIEKPLRKREIDALQRFRSYGHEILPYTGSNTMQRLLARGFVQIVHNRGGNFVPDYRLTEAGREECRRRFGDS